MNTEACSLLEIWVLGTFLSLIHYQSWFVYVFYGLNFKLEMKKITARATNITRPLVIHADSTNRAQRPMPPLPMQLPSVLK